MSVPPTSRTAKAEPRRFASAIEWMEASNADAPEGGGEQRGIVVDLIRPDDLLALSVEAVGCELVSGDAPILRPQAGRDDAHLIVRYSFQHLAEQATYEGLEAPQPDPTDPTLFKAGSPFADARPQPPVGARAADGSRLVFGLPAGETVPFSTEGILAAITRLEPLVHDLAVAGAAPSGAYQLSTFPEEIHLIPLPGGLVGALNGTTLVAREANAKDRRQLGTPQRRDDLAAAQFSASAARRVRRMLIGRSAQLAEGTNRPPLTDRLIATKVGGEAIEVPAIFGPAGLIGDRIGSTRAARRYSRKPWAAETAIEAPYRLIISPSIEGRWAHALKPVRGGSAATHVELWHSRLGQAKVSPDGSPAVDEKEAGRRIVRAVWARDRDGVPASVWRAPDFLADADDFPFRMSLSPVDRHMLVRQTAETVPSARRAITPVPIAADRLWLSSLGAWLKLRGSWNTKPYSDASYPSILFMNYLAPLGRDQHVEVAYPGYLFPFGHNATLVKVTDRKMKEAAPPVAALYQRKFLVIGEPKRVYPDTREFPFSQVELDPVVTPSLDDPGPGIPELFWPEVNTQPFQFEVVALDQEGRQVKFPMPLMWVSERNHDFEAIETCYARGLEWRKVGTDKPRREVPFFGQKVAYTPSQGPEKTTVPTATMRFLGKAMRGTSVPRMSSADVLVPAVQQFSPGPPVPITYHPLYRQKGFSSPDNNGELWAAVLTEAVAGEATFDPNVPLPKMLFGQGGSATEKSGGFLAPSVPIRGLSRLTGVVGSADAAAAKLQFDPKKFFASASPKLFGLIDLSDLAVSVDSVLLKIPKVVSEFIGKVDALVADVEKAAAKLADAAAEAQRIIAEAPDKPQKWIDEITDAVSRAQNLESTFDGFKKSIGDAFDKITTEGTSPGATKFVDDLKEAIKAQIKELDDLASALPLFAGNILRAVADLLRTIVGNAVNLAEDMYNYIHGLGESGTLARVQFEWKPELQSWPSGSEPLIEVKKDSLTFTAGAQAGMNGKNEVFALAQLVDFKLHLFPKAELLELQFDRFSFRSGGGKPEVDIVFRNLVFHGVLKFVETIRELVPLDGFSDPPEVKVGPEGLTAGFGLALPDIALGMFSITNMSLNADVQVPFLGKAVTVGFSFCTRERPFNIAVAFIGGGGWVALRLSAEGLEVLEVGLEAGACIAVDFGVASGSVSAMLGIYIRLESEAGSLAAYFRLRGEVDVLGLISAAIELYMALLYHFESGKLIGEARITVNVSVFGLSKSVSIYAQRTFKGANADPSFRQIMVVEADGTSLAWDDYCQAFAKE